MKSALASGCNRLASWMKSMIADRRGNVAISAAICTVPMILAVGASLDYTRAYNVQSKMQADLDAALVAAIKQIDTYDEKKLEQKVIDWFEAQADKSDSSYDIAGVKIDQTGHTITASATGTVPTTIMTIANIESVPVGVTSAIKGPATSYLDVHIVIDKSASMLLASTSADQAMLRSDANITCEFACHSTADPVKNKTTGVTLSPTYYDYIKALGVKLRSDVALDAVEEVLDMVDEADDDHKRIRVGLYSLGEDVSEVLAPTYSTSAARKKLSDDDSGLTSASSKEATYFDTSLTTLAKKIGTGGDGSSSSSPMKLVLLLTDGVQSERNWVLQDKKLTTLRSPTSLGNLRKVVTPLNPDWCAGVQDKNATIAVLYTEYLAIPNDWGYDATLAKNMAGSRWDSVWGGTLHSGVSGSISRQDYIPIALQDCASSPDLFISAASEDEITDGLSTLFTQYLTSVRLTQ
ncbi:pilus assembly protein [Pararhizobium sp. LjRoot255]|uniref:TadE/TadG family type IV pilus assembly protein n=1 Tax=Pararhizobium sp. LjRoot255 TaxID=3342298 RepID=UPI003ECF8532